jgi:cellulose synthase/poly-beta-1,6-N-acetylglucosamine synthase-like glycosyltransferase
MALGDTGAERAQRDFGFASADNIHPLRRGAGQPPPLPAAPPPSPQVLARELQLPLVDWDSNIRLHPMEQARTLPDTGLSARIDGQDLHILCADALTRNELLHHLASLKKRGKQAALAPRAVMEAALESHWRSERLDEAVYGLLTRHPAASAGSRMPLWQVMAAAVGAGLAIGCVSMSPAAALVLLTAALALPFLCITVLRTAALAEALMARRRVTAAAHQQQNDASPAAVDGSLPKYSLLVPLYQETAVLSGLIHALTALDFPAHRLEILLILEENDLDTQAAILALGLPSHFRAIVVPDKAPQTKPKALNYALQFANGDFIVVYDAEDRPEPDQLRRALAAFANGPADLGCVQAQLNIYNPNSTWFSRQFTIEYSALFDALLPALARLRLPVPLGGTSNHFRREALTGSGAWDPFNVTEDADLGFRLARHGWHTQVLGSTTCEEAPIHFRQWLRQRSRWMRGWMQTYLVHTRRPWRLTADLGLRGVLGVHILMGALILSALAHPWFYLLLAYHAWSGQFLAWSATPAGQALWMIAWINLTAGYLIAIAVGAVSVWRRGRRRLALSTLFMPIAWLLVSLAAYRALYQLATDPYRWDKTAHGLSPRRRRSHGKPKT